MELTDTIVAIATPPGQGALGIVRLSGANAITIADVLFSGPALSSKRGNTIHYGNIIDDKGGVVDEVLTSIFKAPRSYTGEDVVEISCHGSPYILRHIVELCIEHGARLAKPGEFTQRAFLNGKMDLTEAEGVADLIASESAAEHKMAMQQMRGGFSAEIQRLRDELINFASLVELELDFGEEDVEFADREKLKSLVEQVLDYINKLIDSFQLGNAIKSGITTVIAGRPNAGKSTLLNALLNEERAIVSDVAGTTRDTIEEQLNINGMRFRLIDTAGLREATDTIEKMGVQRTMEEIGKSSVLVYVFDVVETGIEEVKEDLKRLDETLRRAQVDSSVNTIVVANKMDLHPNFAPPRFPARMTRSVGPLGDPPQSPLEMGEGTRISDVVWVTMSAKNHMNVEELKQQLYAMAISGDLQEGDIIVSNVRHYEALKRSAESLAQVKKGLQSGVSQDFIAMDIRHALHALGEITGEITTDDLLGNIFSKFCIGK